jgi:3-deoxy-D-manno-octulosonic-acid transferase
VTVADPIPFTLRAYQLVSAAATPLAPKLLARRLTRGKEHPVRLPERRGEASVARPQGPLIWLHGASVGEVLAVIPLIERIRAQDFAVLVTSGTVTSAGLAKQRLPAGALHQFIPLDAPSFVARFLDHWKPDVALFVESDLWPNLILASEQRKVPMILVNGRVSERSFKRWRLLPGTIGALIGRFDLCLTQTTLDAQRFAELGAPRITNTGNLKLDAPAPPADPATSALFKSSIGGRAVIAAASTHAGEEAAVIDAHRRLRDKYPNLLTLLAPRHPDRGQAIAELAKAAGLNAALRSRDALPEKNIDIYVVDTLGELGMIYRLAPIVFMGGSLARHGGQNPIEAVKLGAAVMHGPHVWNFGEIYATLDQSGGAELVADGDALTARLDAWLADPALPKAAAEAAVTTAKTLGGALERTLAALEPYLMKLRLEQQAGDA